MSRPGIHCVETQSLVLIKKSSLPGDGLRNYHPVSGLCFLSKLVKRVIDSGSSPISIITVWTILICLLTNWVILQKLLYCQLKMRHNSLAHGELTAVVLLDLSEAFDTVDHLWSSPRVCAGPIVILTPLSKIISFHPDIKFHFYEDDTQLYVQIVHLSQKNASAALIKLNACLQEVQQWMALCKLKLNPDETEFIVLCLSITIVFLKVQH